MDEQLCISSEKHISLGGSIFRDRNLVAPVSHLHLELLSAIGRQGTLTGFQLDKETKCCNGRVLTCEQVV